MVAQNMAGIRGLDLYAVLISVLCSCRGILPAIDLISVNALVGVSYCFSIMSK